MSLKKQIQSDRAACRAQSDCPNCGATAKSLPENALPPRPVEPRLYRRWLLARECSCGWKNENAQTVRLFGLLEEE